MKRNAWGLGVALLAMAGVAAAEQPGTLPTGGKSVMLYFSKPVGGALTRRQDAASFGFRLQQGSSMAVQRSVPLLDLRWRADGRKSVSGAGVLMFDSFEPLRLGSSTGSSFHEHPWVTGIAIGAGVLGAACVLNLVICDGDGSDGYTPPTG